MAESSKGAVSSRREFIRSAWAVPVVATFALGATAAEAGVLKPNSTACKVLEKLDPPLAWGLGCRTANNTVG